LGIILAGLAQISIGKLLIAIIIPGLIMALLYGIYIFVRAWLQPELAPAYELPLVPWRERIEAALVYVLPLTIIIFLVIGVIFLGIATPSEAAALGAVGCFLLAAIYRRLSWSLIKQSCMGTLRVSAMIFLIFIGAAAFNQLLVYTEVTPNLVNMATVLPLSPIATLIIMQLIVMILGMFMESVSILMVCLPLYMPLVKVLGFNPIWFGVIMLINVEIATISPPFGLCLFAMKAVAPDGTTMLDIYRASIPYWILDIILMGLVIAWPQLALWPLSLMK
jgi:tripartite ATP-independent transporter DctM subunit